MKKRGCVIALLVPRGQLDDSFDFKKSLEVVNLSKRHGNEEEGFKHRPPHYSGVCIVIDWGGRDKMI